MPAQSLSTTPAGPTLAPARSTTPAPALGPGNAARAASLPATGAQATADSGQGAWGASAAPVSAAWSSAPSRDEVLNGAKLTRGQEGPLVAWVQAALVRLGLPVGQTGQYGPTTAGVVTEFQRIWGVGQTGEVGPQTLNIMTKAVTCSVSLAEFRAMNPGVPEATARAYLPHLNASMLRANISTDARKAAYMAQLGHESDGFNTLEEYASGADYEGRTDLGNTQRGDGRRFKGRGPIQITGRANYRSYGQEIGVDLIQQPELAATPAVGFQLAAAYWSRNDLNRYADRGEFDTVSRRINGGDNGRADRRARWATAQTVLARTAKAPKVVPAPTPQRPGPAAPTPSPAPAPAEAGALDAAAAPLAAGAWAGAAAAATDFAASPEAQANPALAAGAGQLVRAAALLSAASAALQAGDGPTTKAKAHEGANQLRALRDEGLLSPSTADQAISAAGALWRRADQARPNAAPPAPAPAAPAEAPGPAASLERVARAIQGGELLEQGDEGEAVAALQRLLGMQGEAITGRFGPSTTAIVKDAQSKAGLPADGVVGPATLGALRGNATASSRTQDLAALTAAISARALRLGDTGPGVSALQRLLGMGASGTTGTFGQTTRAVLIRFQRDNGLEADGIAGQGTLSALRGGGAGGGQAVGSYDAYRFGKHLGKIKIVRMDGVLMAEGMVPHWTRLRDAAARDGVRLKLNSGFRTMDEQRALYQGYVNGTRGLAAAPGYSNHQHGEAVDIDVVSDAAYNWMFRNAPRMGWHNTVPSEPWHWEYFWRR